MKPAGRARPALAVVGDRPDLIVHAADHTESARTLARTMARELDSLFIFAGEPVLVARMHGDKPKVRALTRNRVIIETHKIATPVKFNANGERREVTLPDKVADLVLDILADEQMLRPLLGFTTGPLMHGDGSITTDGYDRELQVLVCNVPTLAVPDEVSKESTEDALRQLRLAFRTFPFADREIVTENFTIGGKSVAIDVVDQKKPPGADESAFLVALVTAIARASLHLAPGFAAIAPQISGAGAGKTYLMDGIGIVAFGHAPSPKGIGTGEEQEKGIVAALIRPDPFNLLDNINGRTLTSENLCIALSERGGEMRVLGASEMRSANPTAFIGITGNALTIGLDLVRRIITFEIDAHCEHPERREFAGDFIADITAQRAELLQAALTILRYGRQWEATLPRGEPLGSYPQWCRWIRDTLLDLGCVDPVTRITAAKQADPTRINALEIFTMWWECHKNTKITVNDLKPKIKTAILAQVDQKKRNRWRLAAQVRKLKNTEVGGFRLTAEGYNPITYQLIFINKTDDVRESETPEAKPTAASETPEAAVLEAERAAIDDADADGWQFNKEPPLQDEPPQRPPEPFDPEFAVRVWKNAFTPLQPQREPCPGWRAGEWPRAHACINKLLRSPLALAVAKAGWSALDLFAVHKEVGVAARHCTGALIGNVTAGFVAGVERDGTIRFTNNTAARKHELDAASCVLVWNFQRARREPPAAFEIVGDCTSAGKTAPPTGVTS